jgi:hypothetical protein
VTGAEEHSLWSAILPIAGAIGGSFIPGLGTALGASLGGALGGAGGSLIDHGNFAQTALAGLGGGAGGYLGAGGGLGSLLGSGAAGAATAAPSTIAASGANAFGPGLSPELGGLTAGMSAGVNGIPGVAQAAASPTLGSILKTGMGASLGSGLAASLSPGSTASALPPGFGNHMPPLNPNFNALRGSTQGSAPNFNGYNPYAAVTGAPYNFYPGA